MRFATKNFLNFCAVLSFVATSPSARATEPKQVTAFGAGRLQVLGSHTDYNNGLVAATALDLGITAKLTPNPNDMTVKIVSHMTGKDGLPQVLNYEYELGKEKKVGSWPDYFQGLTAELRNPEVKKELGINAFPSRGYLLELTTTVPEGAGVSSSAAAEVAHIRAFREAFGYEKEIDDVLVAKIGQRIEGHYVGGSIGLMDQLTSSLSKNGSLLLMDFADPKTPSYKIIPNNCDFEWVVFNSGVAHSLSSDHGDNFKTRVKETTDDSLVALNKSRAQSGKPLLKNLSDLKPNDLDSVEVTALPAKLRRRVTHIVTENARVTRGVEALTSGDSEAFGKILSESHLSSMKNYEIVVPEVQKAWEIAVGDKNVLGAAQIGGGFGGSISIAVKKGKAQEVSERLERQYAAAIAKMYRANISEAPDGKVTVGYNRSKSKCVKSVIGWL